MPNRIATEPFIIRRQCSLLPWMIKAKIIVPAVYRISGREATLDSLSLIRRSRLTFS